MKFALETTVRTSGRIGYLTNIARLPENVEFKTPLLLLSTKGGSLPFLSRETFETLNIPRAAIQINLSNTVSMENALKVFKKGISEFGGLGDCLTFVTLKVHLFCFT